MKNVSCFCPYNESQRGHKQHSTLFTYIVQRANVIFQNIVLSAQQKKENYKPL